MKDLRWKIVSSEYLFKDNWFTVRKDSCVTAEGKIISPYYVYEFPDWVNAVAFTDDGRLIMERQYRHAIGETSFELPGGCIDATDASPEEAMARELMEETGYQFDHFEYLGKTSANPSTNSNWMHMYLATGGKLVKEQALDHNEEIEIYLYSVDEVKQLIRENKIIQSMHITTLLYAFDKMGQLRF
jgi:ADP-ribose pyrophosphatase